MLGLPTAVCYVLRLLNNCDIDAIGSSKGVFPITPFLGSYKERWQCDVFLHNQGLLHLSIYGASVIRSGFYDFFKFCTLFACEMRLY